jgi:SAM-dependent methyltransferase
MGTKRTSEATARNREPIRQALATCLPNQGLVLEIASGTGEHAVHMAAAFPFVAWQPSDIDDDALASIAAWRDEAALPNLLTPLALDVTSSPWPVAAADAIVCINMVHISPWDATLALFAGAARTLPPNGLLYLYGPYRFHGKFTAPSNEAFDQSLRARDPSWGVRDVRELTVAGTRAGFGLEHTIAMPANNHSLVFRRKAVMPPTGKFQV